MNQKWIELICLHQKLSLEIASCFTANKKKIANAKWIWVVSTVKFNEIVKNNNQYEEKRIKKTIQFFRKYFNCFRHNEWRTPTLSSIRWILWIIWIYFAAYYIKNKTYVFSIQYSVFSIHGHTKNFKNDTLNTTIPFRWQTKNDAENWKERRESETYRLLFE